MYLEIKNFLKKNKELIENEDWDQFFINAFKSLTDDAFIITELIDTLDAPGIDYYSDYFTYLNINNPVVDRNRIFTAILKALHYIYKHDLGIASHNTFKAHTKRLAKMALRLGFDVYGWKRLPNDYVIVSPKSNIYDHLDSTDLIRAGNSDAPIKATEFYRVNKI